LTRNLVCVLGPAIGGILVVAASPGIALAADAVTFLVCAYLLSMIRIAGRAPAETSGFLSELREGWREFTARTWLWASVLFFGLGNLMFAGWIVLGPVIAKSELGGAGPWAAILTSFGVGAVLGSVTAIRLRPRRPLVACVVAAVPLSLQTLSLALEAPAWVVGGAAFLAGIGLSIHLTLWFTVFQREVPERVQSRVASYDTLGSFVLIPIGVAVVGPLSDVIGITTTLWIAVVGMWLCWVAILALPSVWAIRQVPTQPATASA
jgi:hypothetical protein